MVVVARMRRRADADRDRVTFLRARRRRRRSDAPLCRAAYPQESWNSGRQRSRLSRLRRASELHLMAKFSFTDDDVNTIELVRTHRTAWGKRR